MLVPKLRYDTSMFITHRRTLFKQAYGDLHSCLILVDNLMAYMNFFRLK